MTHHATSPAKIPHKIIKFPLWSAWMHKVEKKKRVTKNYFFIERKTHCVTELQKKIIYCFSRAGSCGKRCESLVRMEFLSAKQIVESWNFLGFNTHRHNFLSKIEELHWSLIKCDQIYMVFEFFYTLKAIKAAISL